MALIKCPECLNDVSDSAPACPKCGKTLAAGKTTKLDRSEFVGVGCFVQALGLAAPVTGFMLGGGVGAALGLVVLLALLIVGRQMSTFAVCGKCGTRLQDKDAAACPACRSEFPRS